MGPHPRPLRRWSVRRKWLASPRAAASRPCTQPVWSVHLGIVRCGTRACYQSVDTDDDHRRRGLASHLLGVAARWTADRGCDRWVIVTEATNPAGRVYRSLWVRARHRQRPDVPQAAALSHATTGEPSGVGSDELSDNALNCRCRARCRRRRCRLSCALWLVLRASRLGFESSLGPDRLPALARGVVVHGLRVRRSHAAAQAHRVATTPVLLAPFLVTSFAVDIQTGRRNEVKDMVPTCPCL